MRKHLATTSYLLIVISFLFSCRAVQFYGKPDGPFYYHNQKDSVAAQTDSAIVLKGDSLNVVTFNIKKAQKIQLAIAELRQFEKKKNVDIYMLQEMDEKGVQTIAKELHLNYLYIPICHDNADKKDIGNAILTRGSIERPEKLILPHAKWQNQQRRDVTIGEVNIRNRKILVFSAHTETFAMSRKKRMEQVEAIVTHAKNQLKNYEYVLIGGDFNTIFPKDGDMVIDKFNDGGFDWSTSKVGSTASAAYGLIKPRHDYLFSKGLKLKNAYKIHDSKSSDHYPVFATFML